MESKIKCVAIDDEPLALEIIDKFCQRIGNVELSVFSDPASGMDLIRRERPHIAFLDIEMEDVNGLTIASQLPDDTCFIFTTAYLDYALDGYELDAVDYLHKPFSFARFQTAFSKALRRIRLNTDNDRSILVKEEYNNVHIPLTEILYIEAMKGYVKIFRDNDICTVSRVLLKNIGNDLPEKDFIRIHRSFIIRKSKVMSFNKREVILRNGTALPIGRQYCNDVASRLNPSHIR